jgi:hypothetical protein
MPQRRSGNAINADMLRSEIVAMQAAAATAEQGFGADGGATLTLDDLNETERSAALIGVSPDAYKPIPWVRTTHDAPLTSPQPAARSPQPAALARSTRPVPVPVPADEHAPLRATSQGQQPGRKTGAAAGGVQDCLAAMRPRTRGVALQIDEEWFSGFSLSLVQRLKILKNDRCFAPERRRWRFRANANSCIKAA